MRGGTRRKLKRHEIEIAQDEEAQEPNDDRDVARAVTGDRGHREDREPDQDAEDDQEIDDEGEAAFADRGKAHAEVHTLWRYQGADADVALAIKCD